MRREPSRGDVECTFADITKAGRELGYQPRTEFGAGLARFVDWLRCVAPGCGWWAQQYEAGDLPAKSRSASVASIGVPREPSSEYADIF